MCWLFPFRRRPPVEVVPPCPGCGAPLTGGPLGTDRDLVRQAREMRDDAEPAHERTCVSCSRTWMIELALALAVRTASFDEVWGQRHLHYTIGMAHRGSPATLTFTHYERRDEPQRVSRGGLLLLYLEEGRYAALAHGVPPQLWHLLDAKVMR